MKYVAPTERSPQEVLDILDSADATPPDRIRAVLSAIFYADSTEFAGDVLIREFSSANYDEKIYLKNLFGTYYQSRTTAYRIDESIVLLEHYKREHPEHSPEIEGTIEELLEFRTMFGDCTRH